jgi:serine phosphatase RsbU (regulator of sigma subunit)
MRIEDGQINSEAFQRAKLHSESYRIVGILCLLGALLIWTILRSVAAGHLQLLIAQAGLTVIAIAYEVFMLRLVKRALAGKGRLPSAVSVLNAFVEAQIPTLTMFLLIRSQLLSPYHVLVAPAMLAYFLFIILSTLNLSPSLAIFTALSAAIGYLSVAVYVENTYPVKLDPAGFPLPVYYVYAGSILLSGGVAAFVTSRFRTYVIAALHEAELESELKSVRHDLGIARSIQQGLLPTESPGLQDFEIAGWNLPADETGGDYFDWQELPDGKFAISLADATGHGIGPALVGTSCRAYARASLVADGERDGVLDRLNGLLADDLPGNSFVTFAVIFLDPTNSKVMVLSAGHGPILWYKHATDEVDNLEAQGIPLGMLPGIAYEHGTEGRLETGDVLALATDGFFEWENPEGEQFGVPRMETVLRESRGLPAEEIIAKLRAAVNEFSRGTEQKDDLTAVVLRRKDGVMKSVGANGNGSRNGNTN